MEDNLDVFKKTKASFRMYFEGAAEAVWWWIGYGTEKNRRDKDRAMIFG